MDFLTKCRTILSWNLENFDPSFILDVMEKHAQYGKFTSGQEWAIDKIYNKWNPKVEASGNAEIIDQCEELIDWASDKDWFDASFIEDIYEKAEQGYHLTAKQESAINSLYEKYIK